MSRIIYGKMKTRDFWMEVIGEDRLGFCQLVFELRIFTKIFKKRSGTSSVHSAF